LPWIHDVFPTHDGKFIQFVAQNRRRCETGDDEGSRNITRRMAPQVALFQHVPVRRVVMDEGGIDETRYRLVPHHQADPDGVATRFVCRFSTGQETLSVFNFSYEWIIRRRKVKEMFHENGKDNKQFGTSQLLFKCPVPESLFETVRTGVSVRDDYATIFIDLIPIRTPPRYGSPDQFLPPYYKEFERTLQTNDTFDPTIEWGDHHLLPRIDDSGRWENIPICKTSLSTYGKQHENSKLLAPAPSDDERNPMKEHRLVSCLWASAGYATRGDLFAINDGHRRLLEWITYNKLIGVDHFYLYDNSGAFSSETSLKPIANLFPNDVTVIDWPGKVCNNREGTVGERSSQYAAEASCRLRFGPHTEWIAQVRILHWWILAALFLLV
jgi:Glycosyltransferase family 92